MKQRVVAKMVPRRFRTDPGHDQFYALCTYRRSGSGVVTPVWMAAVAGRRYAFTPGRSGKVRRIRHTAAVSVAPSDFTGNPYPPWRSGHARLLDGSEARRARLALSAKYGWKFRIAWLLMVLTQWRRRGGQPVGLEITLDDHQEASE